MLLTKPFALIAITLTSACLFILLSQPQPQQSYRKPDSMARSFILWLHGLGDSGPANEPIKTLFTSPEFRNAIWSFPSAPSNPVTCNCTFTICTISGFLLVFSASLAICASLSHDFGSRLKCNYSKWVLLPIFCYMVGIASLCMI